MTDQALGGGGFPNIPAAGGWREAPQQLFRDYAWAVLCVVVATLATLALSGSGTHAVQLFVFVVAVAAAARLGGFGPGIAAAAAVVLIADFLFVPPIYE